MCLICSSYVVHKALHFYTVGRNVKECNHYGKKTVWRFLKTLKIELLYDPAIPHLDIHLKKMETLTSTDICIPVVTEALL